MRTDDVAQEGLARGRRASVVPITMSMMLPPGGPGTPPGGGKLGFNTFAMWGLCFVVVGVCYFLEQKELGSDIRIAVQGEIHRQRKARI